MLLPNVHAFSIDGTNIQNEGLVHFFCYNFQITTNLNLIRISGQVVK